MKPKQKTKTVRIEYWDCGDPAHHHRSESVAAACMEKRASRKLPKNKWTKERLAALLSRYRKGETQSAIARDVGLSTAQISAMIRKAQFQERMRNHVGAGPECPDAVIQECALNCAMFSRFAGGSTARFISMLTHLT